MLVAGLVGGIIYKVVKNRRAKRRKADMERQQAEDIERRRLRAEKKREAAEARQLEQEAKIENQRKIREAIIKEVEELRNNLAAREEERQELERKRDEAEALEALMENAAAAEKKDADETAVFDRTALFTSEEFARAGFRDADTLAKDNYEVVVEFYSEAKSEERSASFSEINAAGSESVGLISGLSLIAPTSNVQSDQNDKWRDSLMVRKTCEGAQAWGGAGVSGGAAGPGQPDLTP